MCFVEKSAESIEPPFEYDGLAVGITKDLAVSGRLCLRSRDIDAGVVGGSNPILLLPDKDIDVPLPEGESLCLVIKSSSSSILYESSLSSMGSSNFFAQAASWSTRLGSTSRKGRNSSP